MNPALIDPHNHAPAVAAGDAWADVEGCLSGPIVIEDVDEWEDEQDEMEVDLPDTLPLAVIPPKRQKESAASATVSAKEEGLRIEPRIERLASNGVEDGIHSQEIESQVVRLDPEVAHPPQRARDISFLPKPPKSGRGRRRTGESHEWGLSTRTSVRWIAWGFLATAGTVVVSLLILPWINEPNAVAPPSQGLVVDKDDDNEEVAALNDMLARKDEAIRILREISLAKSSSNFLGKLRKVPHLENLLRGRLNEMLVPPNWTPPIDLDWLAYYEGGRSIGVLETSMPDFSRSTFYFVSIGGELQLDWKASVGYGTASFAEMVQGSGNGAEIRVLASRADFYTSVFPEAEFQCFQLFSPRGDHSIWGYSRRGDPVGDQLEQLTSKGAVTNEAPDKIKLTLRLARSEMDGLPTQWLVEEMLHKDWIQT